MRAPATHAAIESDAVRPVVDTVDAMARATRGHVDPHEVLPRPGARLAQQLADAAAALATGKVGDWLGKPAVEALERRGQGELVRRLEQSLYEAARAAPQTADWRSMILPFMVGDMLRPLRLYVRQRHERAREKQQGTRFVLECDHDELGALQLQRPARVPGHPGVPRDAARRARDAPRRRGGVAPETHPLATGVGSGACPAQRRSPRATALKAAFNCR
jgi:hypothetical protein